MILLTPGPCATSESVRQSAAAEDVNHREDAFLEVVVDVRHRLLSLYDGLEGFVPYLIGGSGTAAMEAMVTSCVGSGKSLIITNGYYSERMAELFEVHRMPHEVLSFDWLSEIDVQRLTAILNAGSFKAVFVTHHETTTGRLNDLAPISKACKEAGVALYVDAISSFGSDELPLEGVTGFCASSNKCLHGIPGVSMVFLQEEKAVQIRSSLPRTYYLHLPRYEGKIPPLTPPIPALRALRQALQELDSVASRNASYLAKKRILQEAASSKGWTSPLQEEDQSSTLLMLNLPLNMSFDGWYRKNLEAGFVIYGCKKELFERFFQVSVMGETTAAEMQQWSNFVASI